MRYMLPSLRRTMRPVPPSLCITIAMVSLWAVWAHTQTPPAVDIVGTVRVGSGVGTGSLSPIEIVNTTDSGIALTSTSAAAAGAVENYLMFSLKDSAGALQKIAVTAGQWTDKSPTGGYASWNEHASAMIAGVQTDFFGLVHWANNGAAFFPLGLSAAHQPGPGVLKINGDTATHAALVIATADASRSLSLGTGTTGYLQTETATPLTLGTGGSERLRIDASGYVGIGTSTPGAQLDLSTDSARKLTTTTWATGSDARIKRHIATISDGLAIVRRIRPVTYRYRPEFLAAHPSVADVEYYHFIAQDYRQVFPDSVTQGDDGLLYLNSANMIPYAIAAIKELDQQVRQRDSAIRVLETRLSALEKQRSNP